jgi:ketosteroid isomerase-like protein
MSDAEDLVRSFYHAIEAGRHGDQLGEFLSSEARTIEHPNAIAPQGRVADRAAMLAGSTAGAKLLSSQRYDVRSLAEIDGTVAVRLTWTGVIANAAGPFTAGQRLTAHIAQFVRISDGKIAEIETYDCYEPFATTPA